MTDEEEDHKSDLRTRRSLSQIGPRFLLIGVILCRYSPGESFWEYVLPGNVQEFNANLFANSYLDDVPVHFSDTIDQILIDWLAQKSSPEQSVEKMRDVIDELLTFRRENPIVSHRIPGEGSRIEGPDLLPHLVESLNELSVSILPNEEKRVALGTLISHFRDSYHYVGLTGGDHPLGRG